MSHRRTGALFAVMVALWAGLTAGGGRHGDGTVTMEEQDGRSR